MSDSLWPHGLVHGILQARILQWVAFHFSKGSSQPRDQTQVSHIEDGFFTSWPTRQAQEYWSGYPIPSPVDLPNPGIEPGSPALQVDSLPGELSGKPRELTKYLVEGMTGSVLCWSCLIPACENQWSSFLFSLVTYSVTSGWQFKTNHCRSVYSIEIGKHYKLWLFY